MPVFGIKLYEAVVDTTRHMGETFFGNTPLILTPDEFIAAFIRPEDVKVLNEIQSLFSGALTSGPGHVLVQHAGASHTITYGFMHSAPITVPPYVKSGLQPTCPDDIKNKIDFWMSERIRIGDALGCAVDAISYLQDYCTDVASMKLLLPAIVTVLGNVHDPDGKLTKRARESAASGKFSRLPKMPPETKNALAEASAVLNAVFLAKGAPAPKLSKGQAVMHLAGRGTSRKNIFVGGAGSFL